MNIYSKFQQILGEGALLEEPMKGHTSFRIGGAADYYLLPGSIDELKRVLEVIKQEGLPYYLCGNGSNLLVCDQGFRGAILSLSRMQQIRVNPQEGKIWAQAGASLIRVSASARDASLEGLAFACGIPGSVGGAVVMNAGAYGGELSQVLLGASLLTESGEVIFVPKEELSLSYRHSRLMESGEICLEAVFALSPGDGEQIAEKMKELLLARAQKQPLEYPSAGSSFKRPQGYFAGKLIQDCGLKGFTLGGAQVSEKHSGFVINTGGATAADVVELMRHVRRTVYRAYQVYLEPEIRYLGPEGEEKNWLSDSSL